ncbi:unnamed protein product [Gongylonema pulchrum]|uniref:Geranylgeranyl transferase type-2 subunit alpha n=1 Tax=Gongylonema pulchrum TaxID=637853 RepID=A0A183ESW1_9BILA|nr:unnamed protein product [Gongylonema pulchrum]
MSDEQKEKRKVEQTTKLKAYCKTRDRIFDERSKGKMDEEMLTLTAALLVKNPDFYTLWNIRREIIGFLSQKITNECAEESVKRMDEIFNAELQLTQACLEVSGFFFFFAKFYRLDSELVCFKAIFFALSFLFFCCNLRLHAIFRCKF